MDPADSKYGVISASKKAFHVGEPVFLIRGTDALACEAIRAYGKLAADAGRPTSFLSDIADHERAVAAWQAVHVELVKDPD